MKWDKDPEPHDTTSKWKTAGWWSLGWLVLIGALALYWADCRMVRPSQHPPLRVGEDLHAGAGRRFLRRPGHHSDVHLPARPHSRSGEQRAKAGALFAVLLDSILSHLFSDCDGIVAVGETSYPNGRALQKAVLESPGQLLLGSTEYVGEDPGGACGAPHYTVEWAIKLVRYPNDDDTYG